MCVYIYIYIYIYIYTPPPQEFGLFMGLCVMSAYLSVALETDNIIPLSLSISLYIYIYIYTHNYRNAFLAKTATRKQEA